jgi:hypothetical protein
VNTSSGYSAAYKFSKQPGDPGCSASENISLCDSAVPEPSTIALLGLGGAALAWKFSKRRSKG